MSKEGKTKTLHLVLCACVIALFALYLFFANSIAGDRFTLDETETELVELQNRNTELTLLARDEQSLDILQTRSQDLALEEVTNIIYIEARAESPLVLRN